MSGSSSERKIGSLPAMLRGRWRGRGLGLGCDGYVARSFAKANSGGAAAPPRASAPSHTHRKPPLHDHTPREDLPLIISVDDHVMEPRDLWQRELPPAARPRPAHRPRAGAEFTAAATTARDVAEALDRRLAVRRPRRATGRLHGPADAASEVSNVGATYEDFRPGTYNQKDRLADMDTNHVEAG